MTMNCHFAGPRGTIRICNDRPKREPPAVDGQVRDRFALMILEAGGKVAGASGASLSAIAAAVGQEMQKGATISASTLRSKFGLSKDAARTLVTEDGRPAYKVIQHHKAPATIRDNRLDAVDAEKWAKKHATKVQGLTIPSPRACP